MILSRGIVDMKAEKKLMILCLFTCACFIIGLKYIYQIKAIQTKGEIL